MRHPVRNTALAFLVLAVVAVRAPAARACEVPCIAPGTFSGAIGAIGSSVSTALAEATVQLVGHLTVASAEFIANIAGGSTAATRNIEAWFDTFWSYNLLPAMQSSTDQKTAGKKLRDQTVASFKDASQLNAHLLDIQTEKVKSHRIFRPSESVASVMTIVGGLTRAGQFRDAYNASAPVERLGRTANAKDSPSAAGTGADMKDRWDTYTQRYCSKDDNNGAAGCDSDGAFAGKDVDVFGTLFSRDTLDVKNDDTRQTVDDLIVNIVEPFARNPVAPGGVNSDAGHAALLAGESHTAKRQVLYDSLYHIVAQRAPGSGIGAFLVPFRTNAGVKRAATSDNPSANEIMQVMMNERFRTGTYGMSQIDEPENLQRELVIQQITEYMHRVRQLDLKDRESLLKTSEISDNIRAAKRAGSAASGAPLR